ncbi:MAG: L-histidine N(alpha)-methyltransferase [Planctomycetota bacterium]
MLVDEPVQFLDDVINGLNQEQKRLPCKYFYDARVSRLFDEICGLPEYYLTRTEQRIMDRHAEEMAAQLDAGVMLIEFGSGSSSKTRVLLDHLHDAVAYVPLDISESHLLKTSADLRLEYPYLEILPVVADFTTRFELPVSQIPPSHAAIYFPGSTVGNLEPDAARDMLGTIANILGHDGGLLIGIDLQKSPEVIEAAYNDRQGITSQFNLNVLHRVNQELHGDFDIDQFRHVAYYNSNQHRVEIYVESLKYQQINIGDFELGLGSGERILTEYSHKYTIDGFAAMAAEAGFSLHRAWTDEDEYFAVLHLVHEP